MFLDPQNKNTFNKVNIDKINKIQGVVHCKLRYIKMLTPGMKEQDFLKHVKKPLLNGRKREGM